MQTLPNTGDIRQARRRTEETVRQLSTPLMAVLGAVDNATRSVGDLVDRAGNHAQDNRQRANQALSDLQNRVSELPNEIRDLGHRLEPVELRKQADEYTDTLQRAYDDLVRRGRDVFGDFQRQPQVSRAVEGMESSVDAAQQRLEAVVTDLNRVADDLAARFARSTRSVGERTARATESATDRLADQVKTTAEDVAETVSEAGDDAAASTRSGTRKAANRASAPRSSSAQGSSTNRGGSTGSSAGRTASTSTGSTGSAGTDNRRGTSGS